MDFFLRIDQFLYDATPVPAPLLSNARVAIFGQCHPERDIVQVLTVFCLFDGCQLKSREAIGKSVISSLPVKLV